MTTKRQRPSRDSLSRRQQPSFLCHPAQPTYRVRQRLRGVAASTAMTAGPRVGSVAHRAPINAQERLFVLTQLNRLYRIPARPRLLDEGGNLGQQRTALALLLAVKGVEECLGVRVIASAGRPTA
jgi:hypothetical protein